MPVCHGSCVVLDGAGILIRGEAGAGKSSLALLLAQEPGGAFVADDRVVLAAGDGGVTATQHPSLAGLVEVRGQGILRACDLGIPTRGGTPLYLVVDLVDAAPRLPEPAGEAEILGHRLPRLVLDRGMRAAGLAPLLVRAAARNALEARRAVSSQPHNPVDSPDRVAESGARPRPVP